MVHVVGKEIRAVKGDSWILTLRLNGRGYKFSDTDRMVFTVRNGNGILFERVAKIDGSEAPGVDETDKNGWVQIAFLTDVTREWDTGIYEWDVRIVLNAVLGEDGGIEDGDEVLTPMRPNVFVVERAVGQI